MHTLTNLCTTILVCFTIPLTTMSGLIYQPDWLHQNNLQRKNPAYLETNQFTHKKRVRFKYWRDKLSMVSELPLYPIVVYPKKDDCTEKARKYRRESDYLDNRPTTTYISTILSKSLGYWLWSQYTYCNWAVRLVWQWRRVLDGWWVEWHWW